MKTSMKTTHLASNGFLSRSFAKAMAATALLIGVLAYSASAQADNVYWSIGLGSPGVTIGMTNARPLPVFVQPQPYYVQPATVFVHPSVVYFQPAPIYVQPRPVYLQPWPVYQQGWAVQGRQHGKGQKHDRRHDSRGYGRAYKY